MHRQFYHPTPPSNPHQFHHAPSTWYSNPYTYHQQTPPTSFLSCMHESAEQHQPWSHAPHMVPDWFSETPASFQNDIKEENVLSSTPNTISGSEVSASPGPPNGQEPFSSGNAPRSPYEWMRKNSYHPQPGKTYIFP